MLLILNTIKLVLIALNFLPYRITHRRILFLIYLATLLSNGEYLNFNASHAVGKLQLFKFPLLPMVYVDIYADVTKSQYIWPN